MRSATDFPEVRFWLITKRDCSVTTRAFFETNSEALLPLRIQVSTSNSAGGTRRYILVPRRLILQENNEMCATNSKHRILILKRFVG